MYGAISMQVVSLIYVFILSSVYFLKRKYNFLESKVYKGLLVSVMISLVLDIFSIYVMSSGIYNVIVTSWISKLYFVSLFIWLSMFIFYVLLNKTTVKYDNFSIMLKKSFLDYSS